MRSPIPTAATDDAAAESYVRLVLALGQHDAAFVDAYYGPPEWRTAAEQEKLLALRHQQARRRAGGGPAPAAGRSRPATADAELVALRRQYLARQLNALRARVGDAAGPQVPLRRGIARALRRGGAAQRRGDVPGGDRRRWRRASAAAASWRRATRRSARRSSSRPTSSTPCSRRRLPSAADAPRPPRAAARRALHRRLREGQAVERLQLVPGQLRQPHRGQHRPAGLHRPRHRSGVSRGLSRAPRLQRAARTAPGQAARLGRVLGLSAVLAAVADRRRHRQLRHPGGVQRGRAAAVRARDAVSAGRARSGARRRVLRRAGARPSGSATPATKRRAAISTAAWTRPAPPTGWCATR